jgi:short-subunit dehydrogenase
MTTFADQTILITGASSGIGRELARAFARRRARLVLVARRADRLAELSDELVRAGAAGVQPIPADLTQAGACEELRAQAAAGGAIDMLINNAGSGLYGAFAQQDPADVESVMRLNMDALVRLTRLCLPDMLARGGGRIVNVASLAGYQPFPYMTIYAASKAFVIDFSLGLREELRGTGVIVTCICPGTVKTEFFDAGGMEKRRGEFLKMGADAAAVAEECVRGIARGKALFVPGRSNRMSAVIQRIIPGRLMVRLLGNFMRPRE